MPKVSKRPPEIGQQPRADFLPPRIKQLHEGRRNRHNLAIVAIAVAAICGAGYLSVSGVEGASKDRLQSARAEARQILKRQNAYSDMVSLIQEYRDLNAAYTVVSERNVDWSQMVGWIEASVPKGGSLNSMQLVGPASEGTVAASGLTSTMVTMNVTFTSPTLAGVEYFLLDARQWPGYQSALVSQLSHRGTAYEATAVVNFSIAAVSPGQPIPQDPNTGGN